MISIETQSNIILKEINDVVYTAGSGYKIYRFCGIQFFKKTFTEKLIPEIDETNKKESIGFNKKK